MSNKSELLKNSEWWSDPWWEEENWISQSRFSLNEVKEAVDVLKRHFPAQWVAKVREDAVANVFLRNVCFGHSIWQHRYIVTLGKSLQKLEKCSGFSSVVKRLQSLEDSDSASMELELADTFFTASFSVDFPVPASRKGKTPDIVIIQGTETVAIECKQLRASNKERWLEMFYMHASMGLQNALGNETRGLQFIFEEIPVDRYFTSGGTRTHNPIEVAEAVIADVTNQVMRLFTESASPLLFHTPGIGSGHFISKTNPEGIWTRSPSMSDERLFSRLFSNGIYRAAAQLREVDYPGIAAIYAENTPSYDLAQSQFNSVTTASRAEYEHLSAVVIFRRQVLGPYRPPLLLKNSWAKSSFDDLAVSRVFYDVYSPISNNSSS